MLTHKFKLLTGIEACVTSLTGEHQEMLTRQNSKPFPEKVAQVLASVTAYVGETHNPNEKFFMDMLSGDRKKMLVELRQFSNDFEKEFDFMMPFKDKDGNKVDTQFYRTLVHDVPVVDEETGEERMQSVPGLPEMPYKIQFKADANYSEVLKHKQIELELLKSEKRVRYTMLDGYGELRGVGIKKHEISANSLLLMRRVQEARVLTSGETQWIECNISKLPIKDLDQLRVSIKENEGRVDSETIVENPYDKSEVIVDILNTLSFFFPAGTI